MRPWLTTSGRGIFLQIGNRMNWANVVGWEGIYEVSDCGCVRRKETQRILKRSPDSSGYPKVMLSNGERKKCARVHILVAEAFLGKRPQGMQVNHKNSDRADARAKNLEWVTPQENTVHGYMRPERRAACPRGSNHKCAKINEEQALMIRWRLAAGEPSEAIAKDFGITGRAVRNIGAGRTWAHV